MFSDSRSSCDDSKISRRSCNSLADDVLKLTEYFSRINKNDIVLYKLDSLNPSSYTEEGDLYHSCSSKNDENYTFLQNKLKCELEYATVQLLSEYADAATAGVDHNHIAKELESCFLDKSDISFRRFKSMLCEANKRLDNVLEILQLLLSFKGQGTIKTLPVSNERSFIEANDNSMSISHERTLEEAKNAHESSGTLRQSQNQTDPVSDTDRKIVTERFEFAEIDENSLVGDILYVLQGIEGRFIKCDGTGRFTLTTRRRVSRGVRQLTNRICSLGQLYNDIKNAEVSKDLVTQAFFQAILEQLNQYEKLINMLVSNFNNEPMGLRSLYVWTHQPYSRMRLIYLAMEKSSDLLINRIYDLRCRGDSMGRELFTELLRRSMIPYFEILLRWLYYGELYEFSREFFIKRDGKEFFIDYSKVPKFISQDLAKRIYETGKSGFYLCKLRSCSATLRKNADIPSLIISLCGDKEDVNWSIFTSLKKLELILSGVNSSSELGYALIREYGLMKYIQQIRSQLCIDFDKRSDLETLEDFELTTEYGIDLYIPKFSFPLSLLLEERDLSNLVYTKMFRLSSLLKKSAQYLSIAWSEYVWYCKLSKGALELSRRLNWINLCRHEMSHFVQVIQANQSANYILKSFISQVKQEEVCGTVTLGMLRDRHSSMLAKLQIDQFLEIMEILENIIDFSKMLPKLLNQSAMQQLLTLVDTHEGAHPMQLVDFINQYIVSDPVMEIITTRAHSFRENVSLLIQRLLKDDGERLKIVCRLDFNRFYQRNNITINK